MVARVALLGLTLGMAASGVRAELIRVDFTAGATQTASVAVAVGGFAEVCGRPRPGQSVRWGFDADRPMDFNVHHHEGSKVVYAVRQKAAVEMTGTLRAAGDHEYCWMWTNRSDAPGTVTVRFDS